jgi:hypothetical protein
MQRQAPPINKPQANIKHVPTYHTKAADWHDKGKLEEAKASSKSAMSCCDAASKKSATACASK